MGDLKTMRMLCTRIVENDTADFNILAVELFLRKLALKRTKIKQNGQWI